MPEWPDLVEIVTVALTAGLAAAHPEAALALVAAGATVPAVARSVASIAARFARRPTQAMLDDYARRRDDSSAAP